MFKKQSAGNDKQAGDDQRQHGEQLLVPDLEQNMERLERFLGGGADIVCRTLTHRSFPNQRYVLFYMDGIVDGTAIGTMLLGLLEDANSQVKEEADSLYTHLMERSIAVGKIFPATAIEEVGYAMLEGSSVILVDGSLRAIIIDTTGGEGRSVEEPTSQTVVRGPKEGFTENLRTNTALVRRIIKSPKLRFDYKIVGRETRTNIAVIYLQGIAQDDVVKEVHRRIKQIEIDAILESGYIEEFIQDKAFTPFPLIQNTERPDTACASILEGQVVIMVSGTPFVLITPVTFVKFFQSSEDYYQRYDISTFLRLIRMTSFFISMLLPSLYIAITTFHQEMLPTSLLISLAAQREGVPFPALVEAFLMEITFEILREAGVRMPRIIGPAISIVGALVLGQAAVQAGLVSAAMVIVVSFTAIASFVIPAVNMGIAARLIRFVLMILAGSFGLFGIMSGLMVLLAHLCGLRSFGKPYLLPFSPLIVSNLKDTFIRVPWWAMRKRPIGMASNQIPNQNRIGGGKRPDPDQEGA
ncbi:spore germination protein KA [Paenibacillus cellulosilyticus]|uniref:Spore germination protein KA n=1 Tax=Paenibacillus cellulosilyticus TaxID=375489 RepID=A0A2V2YWC8_9BACL|nr:spore germination protein [Paenibacillus cellulosilyticus]PWW01244.1 spore germination protein KA [Paenibacillus cellulosilyticus]QKS46804.1 spore germination protein [Paenibacillus cellulosilyticus]